MDQQKAESFAWRGLLLLLAVAPIPAGSIYPFAQACLTLWAFLLFAVWSTRTDSTGPTLRAEMAPRLLTIVACWILAVLVAIGQSVPLHRNIIAIFSPSLADLYNWTLPDGEILDGARSLSTVPGATIQSGLLLAACCAIFWLVVELCGSRKRIIALAFAITAIGTVEAIYGLARMGGSLATPASGTFINRNHFAALLTMALCLGTGLLLTRWQESQVAEQVGAGGAQIEERLDRWARISPLVAALLTLLAGIIFSFSRMGLTAPLLMLLLYGALWMLGPVSRRTRLVGATVGAITILLLAGAWPALEVVAERFQTIEDNYRLAAWEGTYAIFQSSPIIGTGLGGLADNLPRFLPVAIKEVFDHAHNEPLELLAEGGLIYAGLFGLGLVVYLSTTIGDWFKRQDPVARGIGLGCLAGISAVLLQSMVEFPLRMPANALFLSVILGLGWASIHYRAEPETDTPSQAVAQRPFVRLIFSAMLFAIALGGIGLSSIALAADIMDRVGDGFMKRSGATTSEARQALMQEARHAYQRAIRIESWQPAHAYKLGRAHELAASMLPALGEATQAEWSAASKFYRDAVRVHPANARLQAALGWALLQSGEVAGSGRAVQAALKLSPDDPEVRFAVSKWYLVQWALLPEDDKRAAVALIQKGAGESPERYVEATWLLTGSPAAARQILPSTVSVRRLLLARLTRGGWFLDRWSEQASLPALRLPPPDSGFVILAAGQLRGRQEPPAQARPAGSWTGMVAGWLSSGLTAALDLELPPGEVLLYIPIEGEPAGGIWPTVDLTIGGQAAPLPAVKSPGWHTAYVLLSSKGGTYSVQAVVTNGTILREQGQFVERRAGLGPLRLLSPRPLTEERGQIHQKTRS